MKIKNLRTASNLTAMYDDDALKMISDLMEVAIRKLPGSRECEGVFALWAKNKKSAEPVKQVEFETENFFRRKKWDFDVYNMNIDALDGCSQRTVLDKAILSAHYATCKFFPLKSAMRVLAPLDQREKWYPLTTGYYIYGRPDAAICGSPMVMVLRTSYGTFYAGFMANAFDCNSVQNSDNFAIYLFSALVNAICALAGDEDAVLNCGAAELLDVPERRLEAFRPNPESCLTCFDETHYLFRTLRKSELNLPQEFLDEVDKRRLRIFERYSMKLKLFAK